MLVGGREEPSSAKGLAPPKGSTSGPPRGLDLPSREKDSDPGVAFVLLNGADCGRFAGWARLSLSYCHGGLFRSRVVCSIADARTTQVDLLGRMETPLSEILQAMLRLGSPLPNIIHLWNSLLTRVT